MVAGEGLSPRPQDYDARAKTNVVIEGNHLQRKLPNDGDGSVAKWLNQVTNFNVEIGAIQNPIMADKYLRSELLS